MWALLPGFLTQRLASTTCKEPSQGVGVGSLAHSQTAQEAGAKGGAARREYALGRREEGQAHENVGAHACQLRLLPLAVILSFLFLFFLFLYIGSGRSFAIPAAGYYDVGEETIAIWLR